MEGHRRTVVIWRQVLLPPSESFITNQAAALRQWRPVFAGLYRHRDSLDVPEPRLLNPAMNRARFRRTRMGWCPGFRDLLRHERPNLIHAHFLPDAMVIRNSAWLAGVPLVVTAHGYDVTSSKVQWSGWRMQRVLRSLVKRTVAFVAVSVFIAERLHALGVPDSKIVVLPLGIPLGGEPAPLPPRPGIAFVGRLVEKKGCADLLTAVSLLPQPWRDTPVRIVGDGPLREELTSQADSLGLNAEFLGTQPAPIVAEELRRSHLLCAPSRRASNGDTEGFGLMLLEAAAAGRPAVAYRSGGTAEAVMDGQTGLLVPEGDVSGLSRAILGVLSDGELAARLGAEGRRRVTQEFDIRRTTARLEDLYDRVARP